MYAGIEGRGTEFTCVLGSGADDIVARTTFPAAGPDETLAQATAFLAEAAAQAAPATPLRAVGIACFGPLDYISGSVTYTLKPGWQGFPIVGAVHDALGVPVVLETDVNAAAVAEAAARGVDDLIFVTIGTGTGIGAGVVAGGRPVHGRQHPEIGHLTVRRHPDDDFAGLCPYHGDCLEGLATAKAMAARAGVPAEEAGDDALAIEAFYLAQMITAVTFTVSPQVIVVDGALARVPAFLPALRAATVERFGSDPAVTGIVADIDRYLSPASLADPAALGALELARRIP